MVLSMIEVGKSYRVIVKDYITGDQKIEHGVCTSVNTRGRFATLTLPTGRKESFHFQDLYKWIKEDGVQIRKKKAKLKKK